MFISRSKALRAFNGKDAKLDSLVKTGRIRTRENPRSGEIEYMNRDILTNELGVSKPRRFVRD